VAERHGREVLELALAERLDEADRSGQRILRHLLPDVAQHEIREQALGEAEQVADASDDHGLDAGVPDHLLQRGREILKDHDGLRAGVVQLVLELARRVQRVGVHHREPGAERRGDRHRVLQHVRQHDGDAVALAQARHLLQVGRELPAQAVEVAEGQGPVHHRVGRTLGELREAALDQRLQRRDLVRVDVGRHAGRVVVEPDAFHADPLRRRGRGGGSAAAWAGLSVRLPI
jgi:hypothetical protein